MKGKEIATRLGVAVAGALVDKALDSAPGIIDRMSNKKEEKSFFEENKSWIFIIILSIFITKLEYINMFKNVILNSIINIIFGIIVITLLCLFYYEEKNIFKIKSWFIKILVISIVILGIINSIYHISYAISNFLTLIL